MLRGGRNAVVLAIRPQVHHRPITPAGRPFSSAASASYSSSIPRSFSSPTSAPQLFSHRLLQQQIRSLATMPGRAFYSTPASPPTSRGTATESKTESPEQIQQQEKGTAPPANDPEEAKLSLFQRLKRYGAPAIFIYLVIHCTCFWIVFGVILIGLPPHVFEFMGFEKAPKGPWAQFAVALAVNKMFGPLQALAAIAVTPRLAPVLTSWWVTQRLIAFVARFKP
eukprot:Sspe_Gene.85327::Locus_56096_Transcript_1_1_Confidence_1.000_Length_955::g.85327::m.85327